MRLFFLLWWIQNIRLEQALLRSFQVIVWIGMW
jgi:hypothetical protein